jgi:hypothetical protein
MVTTYKTPVCNVDGGVYTDHEAFASKQERYIFQLNMRLHTLATSIRKKRDFGKYYSKILEPQFGTFQMGPFKGTIGLSFFNSFTDKTKVPEDSFLDSAYKMYVNTIRSLRDVLGEGFVNMFTDFESTIMAWIIIYAIVHKRHANGTLTLDELIILRLLSFALGIQIGLYISDVCHEAYLDYHTAIINFAYDLDEKEEGQESAEPQDGFATKDNAITLVTMGLSILFAATPRDGIFAPVKEFLKMGSSARGNLSHVMSMVSTGFISLLKTFGCPEDALNYFVFSNTNEMVLTFHDKVNDFSIRCKNMDTPFMELAMIYQALRFDYVRVSKSVGKDDKENYPYLMAARKRLEETYYAINSRKLSLRGPRVEPVALMLSGEPATLKSVLGNQIANAINNVTLPDSILDYYHQYPNDFKYTKGPDKFWDGYTPLANVTLFDDVFQARAVPGGSKEDSEAFGIIKTINTACYPLPVAVAENKDTVFFRSSYCIYTTNMQGVDLQEDIHSKEALRRRFHYWATVKVNPAYKDVLDSGITIDVFPEDFWVLDIEEVRGKTIHKLGILPVTNLLDLILERGLKHKEVFDSSSSNLMGLTIDVDSRRLKYAPPVIEEPEVEMESVEPQGSVFFEKGVKKIMSMTPIAAKVQGYRNAKRKKEMAKGFFASSSHTTADIVIQKIVDRGYEETMIKYIHNVTRYELQNEDLYIIIQDMLSDENNVAILQSRRAKDSTADAVMEMVIVALLCREAQGLDPLTGETAPMSSRMNFEYYIEKAKKLGTIMVAMIAVKLASAAIRHLINFLLSIMYGDVNAEPESGNEGRYVHDGRQNKTVPRKHILKRAVKSTPNDKDPQGYWETSYPVNNFYGLSINRNASVDIANVVLKKNFFIMYLVDNTPGKESKKRLGHSLNLFGDIMMMPYHFIISLDSLVKDKGFQDKEIHFTTTNNRRRFRMQLSDFLNSVLEDFVIPEKDVCVISTGQEATSTGVYKYLVSSASSVRKRREVDVTIYTTGQDVNVVELLTHSTTGKFVGHLGVDAAWETENPYVYTVEDVFEYKAPTSRGDCGAFIAVNNPDVGHEVILGIHLAGKNRCGYSTVVTKEDFKLLHDKLRERVFIKEEDLPIAAMCDNSVAQSGLVPDAVVAKEYKTPHNRNTAIRRSNLYGKIEFDERIPYATSKLGEFRSPSGEIVNPLQIALKKYNPEPVAINYRKLGVAMKDYLNLLMQSDLLERRTFSTREALDAFGEHTGSIDSSTSGGWPYNTSACDDYKKKYYRAVSSGNHELADLSFNEINDQVEKCLSMYRSGVRPAFVYTDNLKDEIRPKEKVLEGKTRLFSGSPFIMLILFRRYFGAFMDEFCHMNLRIGSAIGINPYSEDWNALAYRLLRHAEKGSDTLCIGAGDYSAFDCSQQPEVLNMILFMINLWYADFGEDSRIRTLLWTEITSSRHIHDDKLYFWYNSLPSGNPLTAIVNTIYNNLAFRYCWLEAGLDIKLFKDNVYLCALGDDNIFSVSQRFRGVFNEMTLTHLMKSFGLKYTNETKGVSVVPHRAIYEVSFLKRSFRYEKKFNRWVAPISMVTIVNELDWTKKVDANEITKDKAVIALKELSLHGKEKYDKHACQIIESVKNYVDHYPPKVGWPINWNDAITEVLGVEHYLS